MCAKNNSLIFSSFLDIWENVEWPRFFGPPGIWYKLTVSSISYHDYAIEYNNSSK